MSNSAAPGARPGISEIRPLVTIAAPLAAAYLAELMMFVTTKLVVGKLGYLSFAAVGLAGSMSFEILVVMMGVISITGVLAAQAEGAGDRREAGNAARQGLIVAIIVGLPLTALIWRLDILLGWAGQDSEIIRLARPYHMALAPFALPLLMFAALRNFVAALSRTRSIMVITVIAVGMNWALTEGLVFGRWGLPEMGLAGAGLAASIVNWAMLLALVATIFMTRELRGYGLFRGRLKVDPPVIRVFFYLGAPVAALIAVEAGLFTAVGLLSGVIGPEMLAAHQVLMAWIGFPFMIAMALAEAAMVRVAFQAGRRDPVAARHAGLVALALGGGLMTALIFAPLMLAEEITAMFVPVTDAGFAEVAGVVGQLMALAAAFQVFDGMQVIASRALRGVRDAYAPLWIGAFGYWVLGIGSGWLLAFPGGLGGVGLWIGLAIGIAASALMLAARFLILTRRLIRAAYS